MIINFNKSILHKIIVSAFCLLLATSFAAVSFDAEIDARLRAKMNKGNENVTDFYDEGKIKLGTTVDNVTTTLSLSRNKFKSINFIDFDSFTVEVNDLFSGLLSLQFFHWDFGEGAKGDSDIQLLSDIKYVGLHFDIKPVDIFSFGFGYGVEGFLSNGGASDPYLTPINSMSHAVKTNFTFGGPVPVDILFGVTLNQGFTANITTKPEVSAISQNGEEQTTPVDKRFDMKFGLDRMQMGIGANLYKNWINAYAGVTLPLGAAVSYLASENDITVKKGFIYSVGIDGDIAFSDIGFSIGYYLFFIGPNFVKSLPNLVEDNITGMDELTMKANITPAYSLGIIKISLGIDVFMEEKWTAYASDVTEAPFDVVDARDKLMKAGVLGNYINGNPTVNQIAPYIKTDTKRNPLGLKVEPKLTLMFAPSISVDFLYGLSVTELTDRAEGVDKSTMTHTIGMNVKSKFGYATE